jgi:hypothetical protein
MDNFDSDVRHVLSTALDSTLDLQHRSIAFDPACPDGLRRFATASYGIWFCGDTLWAPNPDITICQKRNPDRTHDHRHMCTISCTVDGRKLLVAADSRISLQNLIQELRTAKKALYLDVAESEPFQVVTVLPAKPGYPISQLSLAYPCNPSPFADLVIWRAGGPIQPLVEAAGALVDGEVRRFITSRHRYPADDFGSIGEDIIIRLHPEMN